MDTGTTGRDGLMDAEKPAIVYDEGSLYAEREKLRKDLERLTADAEGLWLPLRWLLNRKLAKCQAILWKIDNGEW